jgi:hypothetical protein
MLKQKNSSAIPQPIRILKEASFARSPKRSPTTK